MGVSIIVPVHGIEHADADAAFCACLAALEQAVAAGAEAILVADRPGERGARRLEEASPWARVVESDRPGDAVARNAGLRVASGDWILFTDADCVPEPEWYATAARLTESDIDVAAGRMIHPADPGGWTLAVTCFPDFLRGKGGETRNFCTGNVLVRRDLLGDGFAPLPGSGDRILSWRLAREGARMVYAPDMAVRHLAVTHADAMLHRARAYARYSVEARRAETTLPGGWMLRLPAISTAMLWSLRRFTRDLSATILLRGDLGMPVSAMPGVALRCCRFRIAYLGGLLRALRETDGEGEP